MVGHLDFTAVLKYTSQLNWNVEVDHSFQPIVRGPPLFSIQLAECDKADFIEKPPQVLPPPQGPAEQSTTYIPGIEELHQIPLPSSSELTKQEQAALFMYLCKTKVHNNVLGSKSESIFKNLIAKAQEDVPKFQEFVQKMWRCHHYQRIFQVKEEIILFTEALWKKQASYILSLYPLTYKLASHVPLHLNDPNQDHTLMEFVNTITTRGQLPIKMVRPLLQIKRYDLLTNVGELCKIKPAMESDPSKRYVKLVPPVSVDRALDLILASEDIDVVITPSGIKTIVDNVNKNNVWTLPFVIRNILKTDGSIKKVLFIDKKLLANSMSVLDKNKWHAKMTAKWALITNKKDILSRDEKGDPSRISHGLDELFIKNQAKQPEAIPGSYESRPLCSYEDQIEDQKTEEFGVDKTSNKQSRKILRGIRRITPGIPVKGSNLDDLKCDDERKPSTSKPPSTSDYNTKEDELQTRTNMKRISPHLEYNHWLLRKSTHYKMAKHEQRTLNLLVRTRHDGIMNHSKRINYKKTNFNDDVYVSSKLEFQPEYGASVMDCSSSTREFIDLFLRPKSTKLARVRSIGHTQELMMVEVKTPSELRHEVKDPKTMFDPLYAVLTSVMDLAPGQYMLHHTPRDGTFAQAFVANPNGTDFNLEKLYYFCAPEDINVPPTLIDLNVFTTLHFANKCPPGLLMPRTEVNKSAFLGKTTFKTRSWKSKLIKMKKELCSLADNSHTSSAERKKKRKKKKRKKLQF